MAVAAATLAGRLLSAFLPLPNVSLLFLLAVVVPAIREGYRSAFLAAVLSALAYGHYSLELLRERRPSTPAIAVTETR